MAYRGRRRYSSPPQPRWMSLRYPGTCTAGEALAAGTRAFWDPRDGTVTCTDLLHAEAAGLTRSSWHGAPTTGRWVQVLAETRIESLVGPPPAPRERRRSLRGCQHEDFPCCGCDPSLGRQIA